MGLAQSFVNFEFLGAMQYMTVVLVPYHFHLLSLFVLGAKARLYYRDTRPKCGRFHNDPCCLVQPKHAEPE